MKNLKIILVDDNEAFRKAFKNHIACEIGAEIIAEVSNADEFLRIKNLSHADLIFMDILMPGLDDVTLAKKILWNQPHLKILAVTIFVTSLTGFPFSSRLFITPIWFESNFGGLPNLTPLFWASLEFAADYVNYLNYMECNSPISKVYKYLL